MTPCSCLNKQMKPKKVLLSWSSGKDSAWTLHVLQRDPNIEIIGLLTTFNQKFDRVAMHATRRELVEAQAKAADLPLFDVLLPWPCSNENYQQATTTKLIELKDRFMITHVAFGDLFLQDIRSYRENQMDPLDLKPLFPIWNLVTDQLAQTMITSGLKARISCIDPKRLSADFVGRKFDQKLLNDLPNNVDPCGENGEFHTFTYAGPMFHENISIKQGDAVERDGFIFSDIIFRDL